MKKFNIYIAILTLFLGSIGFLEAADDFAQKQALPLEIKLDTLNTLEINPGPILDPNTSLQDLYNYLDMIQNVRIEKNNPELYDGLEGLIQSTIQGLLLSQEPSAPVFPAPIEPTFDIDSVKMILDSLEQNPSAISDPATLIQELEEYLNMIEIAKKRNSNLPLYKGLENLIRSEIEMRKIQSVPKRIKKEKSPKQIKYEEAMRKSLLILHVTPLFQKSMVISSLTPVQQKNMLNYIWENGLANNPQFRSAYHLLLLYALSHNADQIKINNLQAFHQEAQFIPMPTINNPNFGFYTVNMDKIDVGEYPIIQRQQGKDCGYHAAFNGLELYRFATGLIDKKELEDLLPNFDVDKWKSGSMLPCGVGESYISSDSIDAILKSHGLTEKDYSIVESIEEYNVDMDIVPKLALPLFDPKVTQFSHVVIINSRSRDHWTVAVINKTDDQIRVYTADSLFGDVEAKNITKIMELVSQTNVNAAEFEALIKINRTLSSIAEIQKNQQKSIESKNTSIITNLLSLLPILYKTNITMNNYFLRNFQQQILKYIDIQLTDQQLSMFGSIIALAGVPSQPPLATDITKRMLEQLKTIIETTDLPNLPPPDFERDYNTLLEKYSLVTLLELYQIQGRLAELLAETSTQNISKIFNAIEVIKIDLENNNALRDLQNAIPIRALPKIDLDKEYQSIDDMIYLLSQLEMYRFTKQLEQLIIQSKPEQVDKIINAIQMVRVASNFNQAFKDLENIINPFQKGE